MAEQLSKTRMEMAAKAVYALSEMLQKDSEQLMESIGRELHHSNRLGASEPLSDGSEEIVIARCQIVKALYERMGKAVETLSNQTEIIVTAPVLNNCT